MKKRSCNQIAASLLAFEAGVGSCSDCDDCGCVRIHDSATIKWIVKPIQNAVPKKS